AIFKIKKILRLPIFCSFSLSSRWGRPRSIYSNCSLTSLFFFREYAFFSKKLCTENENSEISTLIGSYNHPIHPILQVNWCNLTVRVFTLPYCHKLTNLFWCSFCLSIKHPLTI